LFFSFWRFSHSSLFDISSSIFLLPAVPFMSAEEALAPTSRHQHVLPDGRVAYEWSQTLNDVTVFISVPQGVRGRDLNVCIERSRCRLGLKSNPPYLDVSFFEGTLRTLSFQREVPERSTEREIQRAR
jgi:hypothetical protein